MQNEALFHFGVAVAVLQVIAPTIEREIKGFADVFHRHAEWGVAALWVWSNLTQAIPTPTTKASWVHVWVFNIAHFVAGNGKMLGKRSGCDGMLERTFGTGINEKLREAAAAALEMVRKKEERKE